MLLFMMSSSCRVCGLSVPVYLMQLVHPSEKSFVCWLNKTVSISVNVDVTVGESRSNLREVNITKYIFVINFLGVGT